MNSAAAFAAREINRLHAEVEKLSAASRQSLTSALAAAWQAGRLLIAEKKRVRQTMGRARGCTGSSRISAEPSARRKNTCSSRGPCLTPLCSTA
jgi:hypothetical protein